MAEDTKYSITDQLMVKALLCLGVRPDNVVIDERRQMLWTFNLRMLFKNQGTEYSVQEAVNDIRMGHLSKYVITLESLWAADSFWQMNLKHRDVLTNRA